MRKTSISFVGSGNVATHLAIALHQAGCDIKQVLSRSFDHAQQLAMRVGAEPIDKLRALDKGIDVCMLCVGDNVLYDMGLDLKLPDTLVIHTSGATPMSVLRKVSTRIGVMWSPQTFVRDIAMDYARLPLCIEGNSVEVEQQVEELASMISNCIYHLDGEERREAHLAAVFVSNFVNAINAEAQRYMESRGLDFEMLRPLAEQTLRKWDYGNLVAQQTGPARRHDQKTIDEQRKMLAQMPELLHLYDTMTEIIQRQ